VEARHTATLRPARLLGANRDFDARLLGGGSYEGQRRCAFSLYRQENISERLPVATQSVCPNEASRSVKSRLMAMQQKTLGRRVLFDHLIGACKYRWRHSRRTVRTDIRGRE